MAILGLPIIYKSRYGFTCKCIRVWATANTRTEAFQEWRKLNKNK